jgi:hypothetical protein
MKLSILAGMSLLLFSMLGQAAELTASSGGVFSHARVVINGNSEDSENNAIYLAYATCAKEKQKTQITEIKSSCEKKTIAKRQAKVCSTKVEYDCVNKDENLVIGHGSDGKYIARARMKKDGKLIKASKKSMLDAVESCEDEGVNENASTETVGYCNDKVVSWRNVVVRKCEALTIVSCNSTTKPTLDILNKNYRIK